MTHACKSIGVDIAICNASHNAQELIGNNAIQAGAVMPPSEAQLPDPAALLGASIQASLNGHTHGTARGNFLPEGPFRA